MKKKFTYLQRSVIKYAPIINLGLALKVYAKILDEKEIEENNRVNIKELINDIFVPKKITRKTEKKNETTFNQKQLTIIKHSDLESLGLMFREFALTENPDTLSNSTKDMFLKKPSLNINDRRKKENN